MLPGAAILSEERKPTRNEGSREAGNTTRERAACIDGASEERKKGSDKPTSPQKRGTPLLLAEYRRLSPHHKFAPKNQQKVAWGGFEKIFGKIFRGNVSGERKTPCVSQRKGACLTNENREISNLAMQITKKRTKALLNNRVQRYGKGITFARVLDKICDTRYEFALLVLFVVFESGFLTAEEIVHPIGIG